jgi:hypothetical protein
MIPHDVLTITICVFALFVVLVSALTILDNKAAKTRELRNDS